MTVDWLDALVLQTAEELPCFTHDPELFFSADPAEVESAKEVCQTCPLKVECLEGALRRREPHGVWGGELFVNGVVVARKRPRGRPRTDSLPVAEPVHLPTHGPVPAGAVLRRRPCDHEQCCAAA